MVSADRSPSNISLIKGIGAPLIIVLGLSICTWAAMQVDLDIKVGRLFFRSGQGWLYGNDWPWKMLYSYGTVPGLLLTLAALAMLIAGWMHPRWQKWRKPMLVVFLTAVLGAGLLVNAVLKPYCGRPRPREVKAFNGRWDYCGPCFNSQPGKGMSFPCGHCTMGFLFVTLAYCRPRSKLLAYTGTGFGLIWGSLLGLARSVQGAHFLTDILWSLGVIVATSLFVYYVVAPLLEKGRLQRAIFANRKKSIVGVGAFLVALAIIGLFLTRRPFYEVETQSITIAADVAHLVVVSNVDLVKTDVTYHGQNAHISLLGQGFAFPDAYQQVDFDVQPHGHTLQVNVVFEKHGHFSELRHELWLTLPAAVKGHLTVEIREPSAVIDD